MKAVAEKEEISVEEGRSARTGKLMPELASLALAFALAFSLRGLPELRSAYPVGYDMPYLAFLITRVFDGRPLGLIGFTPPLYLLAWLFYRASGMEIFAFLKLFVPAVYGLLAASFYLFVRKAMGWGRRASLLCTAICILQVPALRLSWDLLRNELGLVMLFLFLAATKVRSRWRRPLLAILSTLTVLSHELPAVLLFIWYGFVLLKHRREATYPFYAFHRWAFLLVFPLSIYATEGLLELGRRVGRWSPLVLAACLLAYGLVGLGYASGTFFRIHDPAVNGYVPWSLVESTIGVGQVPDCIACLRWLNQHAGERAVLVAEQRFAEWALCFLDERIALAFYPHGYRLEDVPIEELLSQFNEIYLIWYAGLDIEGFVELYHRGDIAIYLRP